jgi:hypothetical protein
MFGLIAKLLEIQELLAFIKAFSELGPPPDIEAEQAFRGWLVRLVKIATDIAEETPTTIDDDGVAMVDRFLNSDPAWGIAYRLLTLAFLRSEDVGATSEEDALASELATALASDDKPEISPVLVIGIINMVIGIIRHFRS